MYESHDLKELTTIKENDLSLLEERMEKSATRLCWELIWMGATVFTNMYIESMNRTFQMEGCITKECHSKFTKWEPMFVDSFG